MFESTRVHKAQKPLPSGQIMLEQLLSAIESSSYPVYIYVIPTGDSAPVQVEGPAAHAPSSTSALPSEVMSRLLAVCPEAYARKIKPLLEAGWLTPKGFSELTMEYQLTTTEIMVFLAKYGGWVTEGKNESVNTRIAHLLQMSPHTVRKHIQNILSKIGQAGNRDSVQIHSWAISGGILAINVSAYVTRLLRDAP